MMFNHTNWWYVNHYISDVSSICLHESDSILTNAQYMVADFIAAYGDGIWLTQDVTIYWSDASHGRLNRTSRENGEGSAPSFVEMSHFEAVTSFELQK